MGRMEPRNLPRVTFIDVYGNYVAIVPEKKSAEAELFRGDPSVIDFNQLHYIPDDYELYKIKIHTLRVIDLRTMPNWPSNAQITIFVSRNQSLAVLEQVEDMKKSCRLEISVRPDLFASADNTKTIMCGIDRLVACD